MSETTDEEVLASILLGFLAHPETAVEWTLYEGTFLKIDAKLSLSKVEADTLMKVLARCSAAHARGD
ncbi:MAG TPA: hypothetical protein VNC22_22945 [Sporichthya sp.]|jgi:hypothetical protein|nr:hypothetical protein [Sporichthya sp.]